MQPFATFVVVVLLLNEFTLCQADKYLVLGGNGLLGGEIVSLLRLRNADVTMVNRGNWYWDSKYRIKPFVRHVKCDRYTIKSCTELESVIIEKEFFDMVYDFSSYIPSHLENLLEMLRGHVGRYVYISSDSVYEVCLPSSHGGPSREQDAVRPEDQDKQKELASHDYYGDSKLGCEEVLEREHRFYPELTYMSLRIPDVIGPRDNTDRFWIYFLWIKFQDVLDRPINFPPRLHNQQLSFVSSENVAMMLLSLNDLPNRVYNQAYNLAFKETATLKEFLTIFGNHIGVSNIVFDESTVGGAVYFPSTTRGPLNVTKAQELLNWNPVSLEQGIMKTADFYNFAMNENEFRQQRDGTVQAFVPESKMEKFKAKFKSIYGKEFMFKIKHQEL